MGRRLLSSTTMAGGTASAIRVELARARGADQVHGAYLFSGPPGTGKRDAALWFARLLLCQRAGDEPCEQCGGCLRSGEGGELGRSHPDLWLLEPDGVALKIEQVRELQRKLALVANEGGRRVALLFGVEVDGGGRELPQYHQPMPSRSAAANPI